MKSTDKNFSQPEAIECSLSVIQQPSEDNPLMLKDKWDGKEDREHPTFYSLSRD